VSGVGAWSRCHLASAVHRLGGLFDGRLRWFRQRRVDRCRDWWDHTVARASVVPDHGDHSNYHKHHDRCQQYPADQDKPPQPGDLRFRDGDGAVGRLGEEVETAMGALGRDAQGSVAALGALNVGHGWWNIDSEGSRGQNANLDTARTGPYYNHASLLTGQPAEAGRKTAEPLVSLETHRSLTKHRVIAGLQACCPAFVLFRLTDPQRLVTLTHWRIKCR